MEGEELLQESLKAAKAADKEEAVRETALCCIWPMAMCYRCRAGGMIGIRKGRSIELCSGSDGTAKSMVLDCFATEQQTVGLFLFFNACPGQG